MKIGLIGYGKMGRKIEECALKSGHTIVARTTSTTWDYDALNCADLFMEFTQPTTALSNVIKLAPLKKPIVIGTTGWHAEMDILNNIVDKHQIGILYASNFSLGIQLLLKILSHASTLIDPFQDYDIAGIEYHHNKKKDALSGTAIEISQTIAKNMPRASSLNFSSVRCGSIPGTHTILFDSPADTITISHTARSQEGFAMGAIRAAEWLLNRKGLYTLQHFMDEMLYGSARNNHSAHNTF